VRLSFTAFLLAFCAVERIGMFTDIFSASLTGEKEVFGLVIENWLTVFVGNANECNE
jgi:hypothetical protein